MSEKSENKNTKKCKKQRKTYSDEDNMFRVSREASNKNSLFSDFLSVSRNGIYLGVCE